MEKEIVIVGGGASGLAAAVAAAGKGAKVTLLEQNSTPARKLLLTGNGKCNLTNTQALPDAYRGTHPAFAGEVLSSFSVQDTIAFFMKLGIYTVNHDGWVYPHSEQSSAVLQALLDACRSLPVKMKFSEKVRSIQKDGKGFLVLTDGWKYRADAVLLCCGSSASQTEGADGSGYALAESLGHRLVDVQPALTYLIGRSDAVRRWGGVRVNAAVRLERDGREVIRREGQLQLTEYGVSGIPAFQVSRFAARALAAGEKVFLHINFMPDFDADSLAALFAQIRKQCPYKDTFGVLSGFLPDRLARIFCVPGQDDPVSLANAVTDFSLEITGTGGLKRAQAAAGGIDTEEVSSATMESKLVPGLYLCGEMLDIDGDCGGYNLQFAWSTGILAGRAAAEEA